MSALGVAGLGLVSGQVGAQERSRQPWTRWEGDVHADGHDLLALGGLEMAATAERISDFAGQNLSVDEGVLNADVPEPPSTLVDVIDIDDYGADPTGEEPSDDALDAAIDDLSDGDTLVMTDGEYWFDGEHEIFEDYVTVLGTGSKLRVTGVGYGAYAHFISFGNWTAVSDFGGDTVNATDVSEGDQRIEVEDVSPFSVGDDVTISESKYNNSPTLSWGGTAGRGTCPTRAVIREIDGSTLYLDRGLNYDHDAGNAGVFLLDSVVGGRFVDMHLTDGDGEDETEGFLMCAYARDCKFINCTAENYVGFPFVDIHSLRTVMVDCEATNPVLPEGRASSHWEPFQFRGSTDPTVVRPSIDTCRRGIDINAGSNVVRIFDPRIRNAYLHGICFHSNATQQVYGAYEVYGGRIEGAEEILHDKYHAGYGLSLSPNQSHVKAFGTTVVGRPAAVNTPYGQASNLTLEGCELETFAGTGANVVNGNLRNSRFESVSIVGRGGNDDVALNLAGAENVSVSGDISGSFTDDVVYVGDAENVTLEVNVLDNDTAASDVTIEHSRNVSVTGTLHGSGRSVATSGDVSDVRVVDVDAKADAPPIGHHGADGTVSNLWVTACNTVGGADTDIDFADELETEIEGLWIQNNVCGDVSFHGSASDEDKFVTGNLTGQ
ncbi:hypothetical protein ACFQO4_01130 [Saliphagus sp. GCM10025334]